MAAVAGRMGQGEMGLSELERRAVERLIKKAEARGLSAEVPDVLRAFAGGDHASNGGARAWAAAHPDDDGRFGCCIGNDIQGPEYCLCWTPEYDLLQETPRLATSADQISTQVGLCGDCAYRKTSPERADGWMEEALLDLASGGQPFWCHQGMRRPVRWRHPDGRVVDGDPADYQPPMIDGVPYQADGTPGLLCGGWAARTARASEEVYPGWLMGLVDQLQGGEVLPGAMMWEEIPDRQCGSRSAARGRNPNRTTGRGGSQSSPVIDPVPGTPVAIREQIYAVLRGNPGRSARVYDGDWATAKAMADWYRKRSAGFHVQSSTRRLGLTVAVYARYVAEDVTV